MVGRDGRDLLNVGGPVASPARSPVGLSWPAALLVGGTLTLLLFGGPSSWRAPRRAAPARGPSRCPRPGAARPLLRSARSCRRASRRWRARRVRRSRRRGRADVPRVATTLKSAFGRGSSRRLAATIAAVHPAFDGAAFVAERFAASRARSSSRAASTSPRRSAATCRRRRGDRGSRPLARSRARRDGLEGQGMAPFPYLPHFAFIGAHGLDHFEAGMAAHAGSPGGSRPSGASALPRAPPSGLHAARQRWASDPTAHVRRLVSEGTRPRLPWAPRLRAFDQDPRTGLALLERLKDDPAEYVRRSVANHLNDLAKDHPGSRSRRAGAGSRMPRERRRLVRHALRRSSRPATGALALLGHGEPPRVAMRDSRVRPRASASARPRLPRDAREPRGRPQSLSSTSRSTS